MTRALTVFAVLAPLAVGAWWLIWPHPTRAARVARPYAREFALYLQNDTRFTNVQVRIWEYGSKGPLYVHGRVRSDSDAAELRHRYDALGCPVGVSWDVVVDTNLSGSAR